MPKATSITAFILVITATSFTAYADNGKQLYEKNCTGCHGTEVFTRSNRRITNALALTMQVRQCSYALESKWFDEDIQLVSDYLNKSFYKF